MAFNENDPDGKAQLSGFVQELAELGWLVGRNLRMEVRWGGSDVTQIGIFAKELLALQPDLIVTQGTPATAALHQQRTTIPIVFVGHRPGRSWVRCKPRRARWEYHRVFDV